MSDDLLYGYYSNNFDTITPSICTACLVCGEDVPIFDYQSGLKICDKCKAAIMAMREQVDGERKGDDA